MNIKISLPKEINHKGLFIFGILFYLVSPLVVIQTTIFDDLPGINGWKENKLNDENLFLYIFLVVALVFFFILGSNLAYKFTNLHFTTKRELGSKSSKLIFIITTVFVLFFIYQLKGNAFQGGAGISLNEDDRLQGILSTAGLLVFYLHFAIDQSRTMKFAFLILFIITAVFLLGLGGRMYVIIPAVAYFMRAYNRTALNKKPLWPYFFIPILGALAASILGAIRIGEKMDKIAYFLFAEPIFTSYSAFSYVNQNVIPFFNVPYNFFVSLFNFIPSLIWPGKAETLFGLAGDWARYDNPLGALSVFVSIYADFGIIFGCLFIFFFGAFYGSLHKAFKKGKMNKNLYYCFCAVLPFCFFRDPIGIPLKIFITSFGIIPFILQLIRQSLKK